MKIWRILNGSFVESMEDIDQEEWSIQSITVFNRVLTVKVHLAFGEP